MIARSLCCLKIDILFLYRNDLGFNCMLWLILISDSQSGSDMGHILPVNICCCCFICLFVCLFFCPHDAFGGQSSGWSISFSGEPQILSFNNWGSYTVQIVLHMPVSGGSAVHLVYSILGFIKGKLGVTHSPSEEWFVFFLSICVHAFRREGC